MWKLAAAQEEAVLPNCVGTKGEEHSIIRRRRYDG